MKKSIAVGANAQEKVVRYASELLQEMGLNEKGQITTRGLLFPFADVRLRIIASGMDLKPLTRDDLVMSLLTETLFDLRRQEITSVDWPTLEKAISDHLDKRAAQPVVTYRILFPLNLKGPWISQLKSINVLSLKFKKWSWIQVQKFSGWKDLQESVQRHFGPRPEFWDLLFLGSCTPLIVKAQGRTDQEAFEEANTRFDLVRALINLVMRRGISYQFGGKASPLGYCFPPAFYGVFKLDGSFQAHYYNTEEYRYSEKNLVVPGGQTVKAMLARVHRMKKDIQELAVDMLIKYSRATGTAEWHAAFLSLWQILETFVRPTGEEMKFKDVARGINSFLGPDPLRQDVLETMETSRHNLVHYGKFSTAGSTEVSYLKIIVEMVILKLLRNPRMFDSRGELREFLQHSSLGSSSLRTREKVISRILHSRTQKPS